MILIGESGSTKTEWRIVDHKKNTSLSAQSKGINPYYLDAESILGVMKAGLTDYLDCPMREIYYYGAGCAAEAHQAIIRQCLQQLYPKTRRIEANHDMIAAARSLCGSKSGVACILGTGSNACLYDGATIKEQAPSLGYLLNDEGSGYHIGKQFLLHYFKKTLPKALGEAFDRQFKLTPHELLANIYRHKLANAYIASFAKFIHAHLHHPFVHRMVLDAFREFIALNVCQYTDAEQLPVHFTGSVAFYFQDILRSAGESMRIRIGEITKAPMEGLVEYHSRSARNIHD